MLAGRSRRECQMRKWIAPLLVAALVLSVASPALAAPKAKAKKKPVKISHPYTYKYKNKVATDFKTWGYIRNKSSISEEATVTIKVAKWEGKRSWVTSSGLETQAKVYKTKKFKNAKKYKAVMNIDTKGRYRMRAVLTWIDSQGVERMKRSSWKYVKIVQ